MTRIRRFLGDLRATSAIEFAFVAPLFFFLVWGILEITLITWFSTLLAEGADRAAEYMEAQRMDDLPITDAGIRDAVCKSITVGGLSCDSGKLKIATYYAGVPVGDGFGVPSVIENVGDPLAGSGGQYIVAIGYNWGVMFPTSKLLLAQGGEGSQIQARTYTVLASRVKE